MAKFDTNYVVSVIVNDLDQLTRLRNELTWIREMGGKGVDMRVTIDERKLDPALKKIRAKTKEATKEVSEGLVGTSDAVVKRFSAVLNSMQKFMATIQQAGGTVSSGAAGGAVAAVSPGERRATERVNKTLSNISSRRAKLQEQHLDIERKSVAEARLTTRMEAELKRVERGFEALEARERRVKAFRREQRATTQAVVGAAAGGQAAFNIQPLEQTLSTIQKSIEKKIVRPLTQLADLDLTGLSETLKRLGIRVTSSGRPQRGRGPRVVEGELTDVDLEQARATSGIRRAELQARKERRRQEQEQKFKRELDRLPPEDRARIRNYAKRAGSLFIPGGLEGVPEDPRAARDLIRKELFRRSAAVGAQSGQAVLREDMQSFPPRPGQAGLLRALYDFQEQPSQEPLIGSVVGGRVLEGFNPSGKPIWRWIRGTEAKRAGGVPGRMAPQPGEAELSKFRTLATRGRGTTASGYKAAESRVPELRAFKQEYEAGLKSLEQMRQRMLKAGRDPGQTEAILESMELTQLRGLERQFGVPEGFLTTPKFPEGERRYGRRRGEQISKRLFEQAQRAQILGVPVPKSGQKAVTSRVVQKELKKSQRSIALAEQRMEAFRNYPESEANTAAILETQQRIDSEKEKVQRLREQEIQTKPVGVSETGVALQFQLARDLRRRAGLGLKVLRPILKQPRAERDVTPFKEFLADPENKFMGDFFGIGKEKNLELVESRLQANRQRLDQYLRYSRTLAPRERREMAPVDRLEMLTRLQREYDRESKRKHPREDRLKGIEGALQKEMVTPEDILADTQRLRDIDATLSLPRGKEFPLTLEGETLTPTKQAHPREQETLRRARKLREERLVEERQRIYRKLFGDPESRGRTAELGLYGIRGGKEVIERAFGIRGAEAAAGGPGGLLPPGGLPPAYPPGGGGPFEPGGVERIVAVLLQILAAIQGGGAPGLAGPGDATAVDLQQARAAGALKDQFFALQEKNKLLEQRLTRKTLTPSERRAEQKVKDAEHARLAEERRIRREAESKQAQTAIQGRLGGFGQIPAFEAISEVNKAVTQLSNLGYRMRQTQARIGQAETLGQDTTRYRTGFTRLGLEYRAQLDLANKAIANAVQGAPHIFGELQGDVAQLSQAETARRFAERRVQKLEGAQADVTRTAGLPGTPGLIAAQGRLAHLEGRYGTQDQAKSILARRIADEGRLSAAIRQRVAQQLIAIRATSRERSILEHFRNVLQRVLLYTGAAFFLYNLGAQLNQAFRSAVQLETQLARIQGILAGGITVRRGVQEQAVSGALKFGVPLPDTLQNLQLFAQAGYRGPRLASAATAALAGQVGAGLSAQQAQSLVIAVDQISRGSIKFEDIIERISRIEATRAVSAQDLAVAVQRAGSIVSQFQPDRLGQIDFADLVIGATTAIVERTRVTGNQASTALRFMIARLGAPEVSRSLQQDFGVKLAGRTPNELRPLMDIFGDIAARYQELREGGESVKAAQLIRTIAGARQVNLAAALFEGWDDAMQVAMDSSLALGDVNRRVALQLDTLQVKVQQLQSALAAWAASLLEHGGLAWALKRTLEFLTNRLAAATGPGAAPGLGLGTLGASVGVGGLGLKFIGRLISGVGLIGGSGSMVVAPGLLGKAGIAVRGMSSMILWFSKILGPLGIALGVVGLIMAGLGALKARAERVRVQQEQFGTTDIDYRAIEETEAAQAFRQRARDLGETTNTLARDVGEAAQATMAKFPEELFRSVDRSTIPGSYWKVQEEFLKEMLTRIPGLAEVGADLSAEDQRKAQIRVAADLVRETARFADYPRQFAVTQATQQLEAHGTKLRMGPGLSGVVDPLLPIQTVVGRGPQGEPIFEAAPPSEEVVRGRITKAVLGLTANILDFSRLGTMLTDARGKEVTALDFLSDQILNKGQTLGDALDELAERITGDPKARQNLENVVYDRLIDIFDAEGKLGLARKGVIPEAEGAGSTFINEFIKVYDEAAKEFIKAVAKVNSPLAESLKGLLVQQTDTKNRQRQMAALLTRAAGHAAVRDRYLDALVKFNVQTGEIGAQAGLSKRLGLTFDQPQALLDRSLQTAKILGGIPAQISGDLARVLGKLSGVTPDLTAMSLADIQETGKLQPSTIEQINDSIALGVTKLPPEVIESLNLKKQELLAQLELIQSDEQLFKYLDKEPEVRARLLGVLSGELKLDIATMFTTAQMIAEWVTRTAEKQLEIVTALKEQLALTQHILRIDQIRFEAASQTSISIAEHQARMGAIVGGPVAQFAGARRVLGVRFQEQLSAADETRRRAIETAKAAFEASGETGRMARNEAISRADEKLKEDELTAQEQLANAMRELGQQFEEARLSDIFRRIEQSMEAGTAGVRSLLTDWETLRSASFRSAGESIFTPLGQSLYQQIGTGISDAIVGPYGILGEQLQTLFSFGAQTQADLIYSAHLRGSELFYQAHIRGLADAGVLPEEPGEDAVRGLSRELSREATLSAGLYAFGSPGGGSAAEIAVRAVQIAKESEAAKKGARLQQLRDLALTAGGLYGGAALGTAIGGKNSFASEGAAIGTALGGLKAVTAVLGPFGPLVGGLVFGVLGGLFKKKTPPKPPEINVLDRIDRNTREVVTAIENQTAQLLNLDNRLLNVPASFTVPGYRPLAVGGGVGGGSVLIDNRDIDVTITDSRDPEATAQAVARVLRSESRATGTYVSSRY